jgi:uncharacterized membrane protein YraQ (UPF0718 family)
MGSGNLFLQSISSSEWVKLFNSLIHNLLQALMAKGMHSGPALALLLAGPSLSLPNMLVIRRVLGNKKTSVYIALVVIYSAISGLIFGSII